MNQMISILNKNRVERSFPFPINFSLYPDKDQEPLSCKETRRDRIRKVEREREREREKLG